MTVKYGLKDFAKNSAFNIFIIIQITLVFTVCIFASSSVSQDLKYYNVFSDILDGEGCCISPLIDGSQSFIASADLDDPVTFSDYG